MSDRDRQPCPQCRALNYAADDICVSCGYDLPPGGPQPELRPPAKAEPARPPPEEDQEPELDVAEVVSSELWSGGPYRGSWGWAAIGCAFLVLGLLVDLVAMLFGRQPGLFRFFAQFEWIGIEGWLIGVGAAVGGVVGWGVSGPIAKVLSRWNRRGVRVSVAFVGLGIGAVATSWLLQSISPF